jgi:hypothetical protein
MTLALRGAAAATASCGSIMDRPFRSSGRTCANIAHSRMQGYRAGLSFTTGKWQDGKSGIEHLAHVGHARLMWV